MALVGNISGSGGTSNTIGITGSLIIANPGLGVFPGLGGNDVALFVSGNIADKSGGTPTAPDYTKRGTTVFGGDVVISGTLFGGSPLYIGSSVIFGGPASFSAASGLTGSLTETTAGTSYLVAGTNVTIDSGSSPGQIIISSTATGGGGGSNFFTEGPAANIIYNSGSVAFTGARTGESIDDPADKGSDVQFYFSGSTAQIGSAGSNVALFGGNIVTSGSFNIRTGTGGVVSLSNTGVISGSSNLLAGGDLTVAGTSALVGNVTISGDLAVNGPTSADITTTTSAATVFNTNATSLSIGGDATTLQLGATSGATTIRNNLTVSGDLTVNGTTTTIDSTTVSIQDPIIGLGFTSGSAGRVTIGDRGFFFAGDPNTAPGNLGFVWSNNLSSFIAISTPNSTTSSLGGGGVTIDDYRPLRASKFTLGSSFLTSSDGTTLDLVWGSTPTNYLKFTTDSTTPVIQSVQTSETLVVTASSIGFRHRAGAGSVNFSGETTHGLGIEVRGSGGSLSSTIVSRINTSPGSAGASLVLTGSKLTLGYQTDTIAFEQNSSEIARLSGPGSSPIFRSSTSNSQFTVGTSGGTTDTMILSGSGIQLNAGSSGQSFRRDGSEFLLITSGAAGPNQRTQVIASTGKTLVVGGSSETILSGSSITLVSAQSGLDYGVNFTAEPAGLAQPFLKISSGSYSTPAGSLTINAAKIVPDDQPIPHDLVLGASSGKSVYLSGSSTVVNGGNSAIEIKRHGTTLAVMGGSSPTAFSLQPTSTLTSANLFTTMTTTLNLGGSNTTVIGDLSAGETYLRNAALYISGTTTVAGNILPSGDMTVDLGSASKRFRNMYTGDLHLRNERGNWTIIEERDFLSITNNITGKRYKFVMEEM